MRELVEVVNLEKLAADLAVFYGWTIEEATEYLEEQMIGDKLPIVWVGGVM